MNKKLKRLIEDEEKTTARIEELQAHLKDIRAARKQEEDLEIVRSVRTRKLGARDLLELLEGIQEGRIVIEPESDTETSVDFEDDQKKAETQNKRITGAEDALESEENHE